MSGTTTECSEKVVPYIFILNYSVVS